MEDHPDSIAPTQEASDSPAELAAHRARDWRRGRFAEALVLWHLRLRGWRALARNWRSRAGEIDLIVRRGKTLAFVEVKLRSEDSVGEVVKAHQRRRLERAAEDFALRYGYLRIKNPMTLRFDLAIVESVGIFWRVRYFANAWRSGD